ncbi:hypothetical protein JRO89_XS02G0094300 [Xanthoceras sorbifolium]|uniref:Prolyl 4-hydroxylase alpha subunit domain-containing protein n=1 Tax=Xanthoceras sorbifolium TaxID=99658 RepID=A0ABQ8IG08_9ROSI|nr:hypothetical protein JRO89_XS02G0094300 [Xanthoceras sorbifolium]
MKSKTKRSKRKLGLATTIILCCFFFLAGFYGSTLLSQVRPYIFVYMFMYYDCMYVKERIGVKQDVPKIRPRLRKLELEKSDDDVLMPHGQTGEASIQPIPFQVLSWKPRALYFPSFATAEQCQSIIEMAKVHLKPSSLALRKGETDESTKGTRTSSGTFISSSEDKTGILDFIEKKIARATMIPQTHGELVLLKNMQGTLGSIPSDKLVVWDVVGVAMRVSEVQRNIVITVHLGIQRFAIYSIVLINLLQMASFLLYLSDVEEGGETMFPFENGSNMNSGYDFRKCIGLKVKPRRGDGLLFYSLFPNGTIDRVIASICSKPRPQNFSCLYGRIATEHNNVKTSLHGSCPVIKGQKWVATKWIRDQVQED